MNFLKNGIKIINKDILMEYFRKLKKSCGKIHVTKFTF